MEIKEMRFRDYLKAAKLCQSGMSFTRYMKKGRAMDVFTLFYLLKEFERSTEILAAYEGDRFLGVFSGDFYGNEKFRLPLWARAYIKALGVVFRWDDDEDDGEYDKANRYLYSLYTEKEKPDGEMTFFQRDTDSGIKGIGTFLLNEMAERHKGKEIFLYTDDGCSWQFYEKRGFTRAGRRHCEFEINGHVCPIECYLYYKKL